MANGFGMAPPAGFLLMDEVEDYYPVELVTAYRPGGGWEMGVDPGIEGADRDAHDNPILGHSTMEDYLEGNGEYVTVAMDKQSSWQGQHLESPNYPGVVFKVMDNGGFGNNKTGNSWVDIAFRDPEPAKSMTEQGVPFRPISEEQAKEIRSNRTKPPEGFVLEEELGQQPAVSGELQIENAIDPEAPYMSKPREVEPRRIIMHGDVNEDADQLVQYGRQVDPQRGFAPGYHFYVARDGRVIQGAPVDRITNHTLGANADSIGINIAGADEGKMPTPEQEVAAKQLVSQLGQQYGIDPKNVIGHGELQPSRRHGLEGGNIAKEIRMGGFGPRPKSETTVQPPEGFVPVEDYGADETAPQIEKGSIADKVVETSNDIWRALQRGWKQGEVAIELQKTTPDANVVATKEKEIEALPASQDYLDTWDDAKNAQESWQAFSKNPIGNLGQLIGESLGAMARAQVSYLGKIPERAAQGIAGGVGLGALGGGPVGAAAFGTAGGGIGAATGFAESAMLASRANEYAGSVMESLRESGVDVRDPEQFKKAFTDPELMGKVRAKAENKSVPIAIFDGLSAAVGGRLFSAPAKEVGKKIGQWAAELGVQMGLGGGGEVAGQLASEGKITSPKAVLAEVIAEPTSSVGEVGVGRVQQALTGGSPAAAPAPATAAPAPAPEAPAAAAVPVEVGPEFAPAIGGIRGGLETNLSPEEKGQAAPLAQAAAQYVQSYDESLAPAAAHAEAMKTVPTEFKEAFRLLPGNAMEAEPEQFGEWLARAYEGGKPAAAVPGKSVAQMIREARVEVETKESQQAMEGLAAEPEGVPEAVSEQEVAGLLGAEAVTPQRQEIQRMVLESYGRNWNELTADDRKSITEQSYAIADTVGRPMKDLGIPIEIESDPEGTTVAGDRPLITSAIFLSSPTRRGCMSRNSWRKRRVSLLATTLALSKAKNSSTLLT